MPVWGESGEFCTRGGEPLPGLLAISRKEPRERDDSLCSGSTACKHHVLLSTPSREIREREMTGKRRRFKKTKRRLDIITGKTILLWNSVRWRQEGKRGEKTGGSETRHFNPERWAKTIQDKKRLSLKVKDHERGGWKAQGDLK